jgi:uncharacterized protein YndB with AHSA1/START domain
MTDQEARLPAGTEMRRWVRMSRRLQSSSDRAYRAWTNPEELARWFPLQVEGGLAAGARTELLWPDARVWWDVTELNPPRVFVFRRPWLTDGSVITTVRVTVSPVGYGCPFLLDHPGGLDAWGEALRTWGEALALLGAFLDASVDARERR